MTRPKQQKRGVKKAQAKAVRAWALKDRETGELLLMTIQGHPWKNGIRLKAVTVEIREVAKRSRRGR